ncbi:exported hypothetical protein [Agrobacterium tumefaciens str. B6]|uniref:Uncharacterized protein n=1 Tax=Agrobacterium tumefaciens str. B6 TaxID=1183423 RepID=A0A822VDS6_AGRTU|nr:exported hypothetical protein [Agrobacterium tumefaciens str. B6]
MPLRLRSLNRNPSTVRILVVRASMTGAAAACVVDALNRAKVLAIAISFTMYLLQYGYLRSG